MWIFLILIIIFFIIIYSTVKIEINEKSIDSYSKLRNLEYIISINLFNKIKLISFKIANSKIDKKSKISKKAFRNRNGLFKFIFKKNIIKIEKLKLDLKVGTEDAIFTSYIVSIISIIISTLIAKKVYNFSEEKYKYLVTPLYIQRNAFNLSINCIISIKLVHIIYMIYVLNRKDDEKYGRTSNRRSYDNGDEQHKRYGRCRYNYR